MTSDRTRDLVLPLAVLASVAVGALLGNMFTRLGGAPNSTRASQGETKELIDVLETLRAEIALLREARNDSGRLSAASGRVEIPPTESTSNLDPAQQLQAATRELATAVEALRSAVNRPGGDPGRLVPPPTAQGPQVVDSAAARVAEGKQDEYLLLSHQQVLTQFGKPDVLNGSEWGPTWTYNTASHQLSFRFQDGIVWQVYMQKKR